MKNSPLSFIEAEAARPTAKSLMPESGDIIASGSIRQRRPVRHRRETEGTFNHRRETDGNHGAGSFGSRPE